MGVISMIRTLIAEPVTLARRREEVVATARAVRPDVALLAAAFADRDGITVAAGMHAAVPSCRCAMLSSGWRSSDLQRAAAAGVRGFLVWDSPAQFLTDGPHVAVPSMWIETGNSKLLLELHIFSRPYVHAQDKERDRIVTFTLINRTLPDSDLPRDAQCFFQCELVIEDADGGNCFLEYPEHEGLEEGEEASLRLLHRHRRTYAIGHGCAAAWPDGG